MYAVYTANAWQEKKKRGEFSETKIKCLGCQRNKSLIPRIKERWVKRNAISENTSPRRGRPVEEEAKRERNRRDVTRARVEECRKGEKSPKRVREAPKRRREKELLLFFFRSQNEKEWSLQVELTNATAGGRCRRQLFH
ncbi:hypothetical protein TNCV_3096551 [Trichonephila clavipes]|nr:hypothetical protein TNCV_3096551 [Trichonephila clavipes]